MFLILLEALAALLILALIVWWTMFSGRRKGERVERQRPPDETRWTEAEGIDPLDPARVGQSGKPPAKR